VAVALADKLDTLAGFFAIDEKPTGSRDPFALRRAALGVIRLILESDIRAPISELVQAWYYGLLTYASPGKAVFVHTERWSGLAGSKALTAGGNFKPYLNEFREALLVSDVHVVCVNREFEFDLEYGLRDADPDEPERARFAAYPKVYKEIADFLADRLKVALRDQGKRHDLVDAVFALGDDDLVRIVARVEALDGFLKTEDGVNLLAGFGGGGADGDASMKNLLGGKGANLAEMASLGLPVPPGFTITTEACVHYYANGKQYPAELKAQVAKAWPRSRPPVGKKFGDPRTRCWSRSARAPAPRCRA
jgi:hypothetical protein